MSSRECELPTKYPHQAPNLNRLGECVLSVAPAHNLMSVIVIAGTSTTDNALSSQNTRLEYKRLALRLFSPYHGPADCKTNAETHRRNER
jgi:hypothetical protein